MPEPVIHNASMASIQVPPAQKQEVPKAPVIPADPLTAFENYHFQIKADLYGWMTFSPEYRIEKAKKFSRGSRPQEGEVKVLGPNRERLDADQRVKILNYIIWIESHHPLGQRDVAAVAFNGLFPREEKK